MRGGMVGEKNFSNFACGIELSLYLCPYVSSVYR